MNILIVCAGNSFRSPVAAALFKRRLQLDENSPISVDAAGLSVNGDPDRIAREAVFDSLNLNLIEHAPQQIDTQLVSWADLILCFENDQLTELSQLNLRPETELRMCEVSDPADSGDYAVALKELEKFVDIVVSEFQLEAKCFR